MSALQQSCSVPPSMPRPRLYACADQPARLSLEIGAIEDHAELVRVTAEDRLQMPFCALSRLARSDRTDLPKVLVVAPLSGHFSLSCGIWRWASCPSARSSSPIGSMPAMCPSIAA